MIIIATIIAQNAAEYDCIRRRPEAHRDVELLYIEAPDPDQLSRICIRGDVAKVANLLTYVQAQICAKNEPSNTLPTPFN